MSHCAPTFAAVLALCSVGTPEALSSIDRAKVYSFFYSMKDEATGAFTMHRDGETDTRSVYTVLSIARLLNILTPELSQGCAEYLTLCQSYEGGFGGEPGNEAHGGYNFCALASLLILGRTSCIDLDAQERWVQQRQMRLEGGFQGRTNKTVDSCYSYWQGAALALVNMIRCGGTDTHDLDAFVASSNPNPTPSSLSSSSKPPDDDDVLDADDVQTALPIVSARDEGGSLPFNQKALQRYILHCGQNIEADNVGGLRDKPGKSRDYYHSCYALSGLSIAQRFQVPRQSGAAQVFGDPENLLEPTSAVFNIGLSKLRCTLDYFYALPQPKHADLLLAIS
jgi:protein farnesyltransferase subunit beta